MQFLGGLSLQKLLDRQKFTFFCHVPSLYFLQGLFLQTSPVCLPASFSGRVGKGLITLLSLCVPCWNFLSFACGLYSRGLFPELLCLVLAVRLVLTVTHQQGQCQPGWLLVNFTKLRDKFRRGFVASCKPLNGNSGNGMILLREALTEIIC